MLGSDEEAWTWHHTHGTWYMATTQMTHGTWPHTHMADDTWHNTHGTWYMTNTTYRAPPPHIWHNTHGTWEGALQVLNVAMLPTTGSSHWLLLSGNFRLAANLTVTASAVGDARRRLQSKPHCGIYDLATAVSLYSTAGSCGRQQLMQAAVEAAFVKLSERRFTLA